MYLIMTHKSCQHRGVKGVTAQLVENLVSFLTTCLNSCGWNRKFGFNVRHIDLSDFHVYFYFLLLPF